MNKYQLINNELTSIVRLIRNDINNINNSLINQSIYDKFYQLSGPKATRYTLLANEFRKHPDTIQKIIIDLNKNVR